MTDVLSDLLRAVRFRGAIFYYTEGSSPWVAETPTAAEIAAAILPGSEHMIPFHGIVKGSCWGAIAGAEGIRLAQGDLILFPQGDPHVMSSAPGLRDPSADGSSFFAPRPSQLPHALNLGPARGADAQRERVTIACGYLGLDARPFNPLLQALPRVLHVPGRELGDGAWLTTFLGVVVDESQRRRPGGEAVLERMSEMLFVEVLRRHVDSLPPGSTGWLAGMRDPAVGKALALLHAAPRKAWTLAGLSRAAGLSRTTLHERFVHLLGQPPMQYLTRWRMQLAAARLRDSDAKHLEIALDVGYDSEAAFSRAFKREVGVSPAEWRRGKRPRAREKAGINARRAPSRPNPPGASRDTR
jgi:AraC-like DNA-binding protein